MSIYNLKPKFQNLLRSIVIKWEKQGIGFSRFFILSDIIRYNK